MCSRLADGGEVVAARADPRSGGTGNEGGRADAVLWCCYRKALAEGSDALRTEAGDYIWRLLWDMPMLIDTCHLFLYTTHLLPYGVIGIKDTLLETRDVV